MWLCMLGHEVVGWWVWVCVSGMMTYDSVYGGCAQVRSNHERLIRLNGGSQASKDNPLKLLTTTAWASDRSYLL
jgi:hypothetical protein